MYQRSSRPSDGPRIEPISLIGEVKSERERLQEALTQSYDNSRRTNRFLLNLALAGCMSGAVCGYLVGVGQTSTYMKPKTVEVADVNGDSIDDILFTNNVGQEYIFQGKEDGTFTNNPYQK